jgi:hypothetical protein
VGVRVPSSAPSFFQPIVCGIYGPDFPVARQSRGGSWERPRYWDQCGLGSRRHTRLLHPGRGASCQPRFVPDAEKLPSQESARTSDGRSCSVMPRSHVSHSRTACCLTNSFTRSSIGNSGSHGFLNFMCAGFCLAISTMLPKLFDVRDLLTNGGISDELRRAFIIYLISTNRPFE